MLRALASAALAVLTLVASAACSRVLVSYSDSRNFYSPAYFSYVAGRGPVPAVVYNAPFGDAAVATRIPPPAFAHKATFVAARGPEWLAHDRIVLAFNPEPGTDVTQLCRATEMPGAAGRSRLDVLAVLCRGTYPTSHAVLSAPATQSPDDPTFRELLSQVSLAVFPPLRADGDGCVNQGRC